MVLGRIARALADIPVRQAANLRADGYDYPVWYMVVGDVSSLAAVLVTVGQRHAFTPPDWPLAAGLATLLPLVWIIFGRPGSRLLAVAVVAAAVELLLLLRPVQIDCALGLLVMVTIMIAVSSRTRISLCCTAIAHATLIVPAVCDRIDDVTLCLGMGAIGLSWTLGTMLQTQMRMVQREREMQDIRADRAAAEERRRIAREVHDIAGHSLSITLLHLTGARRALQQDRDVDEALDALVDAEHVGRQAMSDIRRTVGLLASGPAAARPEPGLADLDDLVAGFLAAGLRVRFAAHGDPGAVSAIVGLNLYRITQESLTNVAKHARGSSADVELHITEAAAVLSVRNDTAATGAGGTGAGGSGIAGMRHRAAALGGRLEAGPADCGWLARAVIPLP